MSKTVVTGTLEINNPQGLHARPAQLLVETAMRFESSVELALEAMRADAKSIMHVLSLGAQQGTTLQVEAQGTDAEAAVQALQELVAGEFGGIDSK